MERKEIVANLIKAGAESVKGLKVKNVTVTPCENYVRLALTVDKPVKGMIQNKDGVYEIGETKVIFVSLFTITSLLKDDDDAAFAVNHLAKHPDSMSVVLSRATIDVIIESVEEGQEYKNPWSESAEATVFDHATFIYHITNIKLSEFGINKLDKLADKLLGF